jgi:hypothetical protein
MLIREIINKIDEKHLFIPAFQREYVWKDKQAKRLVRSLISNYPTGTLLTWDTKDPPELKGGYIPDKNTLVKLILDGQQRVTTLYLLIKGETPPYYKDSEIQNKNIVNLCVNMQTLSLEYYNSKNKDNPLWVNLTSIFKNEIRDRDIFEALEENNNGERLDKAFENKISDNFLAINRILDRDFPEQHVPTNATIKEAIDIFYIVNASGVNLTEAELALAQISGYWATARDEFKAKLEELEEKGWIFKLDFIVVALLAVTHQQGTPIKALHSPDNKDKIRHAWKILKDGVLDYVCNLLKNHAYVDHSDEIKSIYALIPIITYVYQKQPNYNLSEEEMNKAIKWFYYSQIYSRYTSQLPQKLDKDIKIIINSDEPFDELLNLIEAEKGSLNIKSVDFKGKTIRHPLFSLMRWYFKSKGAICLGDGLKLQGNMGKKYLLENDHIFSSSRLHNLIDENGDLCYDSNDRISESLVQELTNRAVLTLSANRHKSSMDAYDFLSTARGKYPNALELQCIPENENLWRIENYKEFLKERRERLSTELNKYLSDISITKNTKSEISIEEVIDSGESDVVEFKQTLRWDVEESKYDKKMEWIIIKTISAFNNSNGGKLLIGVHDVNGVITGLQDDYSTLKEGRRNKDGFEGHLNNLINSAFHKDYAPGNIYIKFPVVNEVEFCEIDISKGEYPLYVEEVLKHGIKQKKFFVRGNNSSESLDISEAGSYIQRRFKNSGV